MIIDGLIGVIDQGEAVRGDNLPADVRRRLDIWLGVDVTLRFAIYAKNGAQYDLTGATVTFLVRSKPGESGEKLIEKTAARNLLLGPHICEVAILPADSKKIDGLLTRAFWDLVVLDTASKRHPAVPTSVLRFSPMVQLP